MPKVVKKCEKPKSSVSEELKKFLMSGSGSKIGSLETLPDMTREISPDPKENIIDEVLVNNKNNNSNKKQSKKVANNFKEPQQKFLNMIGKQNELRKQGKEKMIRTLNAVVNQLETDLINMKEGVKICQQRSIDHLQFLNQIVTASSLRVKAVKDMSAAYKKILEGLLTKGAIKPDDRPIWFDVYKKFPPVEEPKFARSKPDIPIRPIFYQEDIARAKIHSQGFGLGAVNMLIPVGDTHTKKLVQQYDKLKAEGVPEDQIVEKCAILVNAERKKEFPSVKVTTETAEQKTSATQQVLGEVDIKNIFEEEKK